MFYSDHDIDGDTDDVTEVAWRAPKVWLDAPRDGLQAVVVLDEPHRVQRGTDIYCTLPGGEIVGTNDLGAIMRVAGLAKYGLYIPTPEFEAVIERVKEYRGRSR